jgi:Fic family protein
MTCNRNKPYNELPLLPPLVDIESKAVLKKAIQANRALARLVGAAGKLPNQTMLINSISLQEAKMSSEIENIITTNDELYQALSVQKKNLNSATNEVLHYQEALWHGVNVVRKKGLITTNLFVELVRIIKQNQAGIRTTPGTTISNSVNGDVVYTPPEGDRIIREKLKNLENYLNLNDEETDPLIKMAVIHYQFEAIHPFNDGNGRTGRIINILYLVQNGLLELPILYLSKFIIENKKAYYEKLRGVTEKKKWEDWILYILEATESTAIYTQHKLDRIVSLMEQTGHEIKQKLPDIYSKELVEVIFMQPYCKRKYIVDFGIAQLKTAGLYLSKLEEKGILKSEQIGKEKLYLNKKLIDILKS